MMAPSMFPVRSIQQHKESAYQRQTLSNISTWPHPKKKKLTFAFIYGQEECVKTFGCQLFDVD
jgi:hypothetical protein